MTSRLRRILASLLVALPAATLLLTTPVQASPAPTRDRTRATDRSSHAPSTPIRKEYDVAAAAARLEVPVDPLRQGLKGLDLLYQRRYADARNLFRQLELDHPDLAIGPLGLAMLAQAQMAENLDFSQEQPYQRAFREVEKRADAAIGRKEALAFNYFMRGTVRGLEGIHRYRHDDMFTAFRVGWAGKGDLEEARKLDPQFVDPLLGVGIYNYWRSAMMRQYSFLKGFSDRRREGLKQMEQARDKGMFSPVLARLALSYTYVKDHQLEKAMRASNEILAAYPDNVITLQLAGQLEARRRNIDVARRHYDRVLQIDPRATQVYYEIGELELTRGGDIARAHDYLSRYVKEDVENWYRVPGRVRLGDACWLMGDKARAEALWRWAAKEDPKLKMAEARVKGFRPRVPGQRNRIDMAAVRAKRAGRASSVQTPSPSPRGSQAAPDTSAQPARRAP